MADIKTRDVTRGTIRTLDRAASSMYHMKEEIIRSKSEGIGGHDTDPDDSYAQDSLEHYAGSSVVYAAKSSTGLAVRSGQKTQEVAGTSSDNENCAQQAFKEQGIKTMRDRKTIAKMADAEDIRSDEEFFSGDIIRRKGERGEQDQIRWSRGLIAGNHRKSTRTVSVSGTITQRQREYGRRKLLRENLPAGRWMITGKGSNRSTRNSAERMIISNKVLAKGTTVLFSSFSVGGAALLLVVIVMILFGAAMTMTDDGNRIVGIGDNAIVEVARAEIGNKGGEKYWKWYGFSSRVDWCAIFCSWCADQCGYIESGILPKFSIVGDGAKWFKSHHRWSGPGYSPRPGDFIFFDYQQNGVLDHVGIVENCDGRTVTTIEGNSRDACKRLTYVIGSSSITGYGLSVSMTSMTFESAITWAEKIAEDGSYHYVVFSDDPKTHECPVCNNHPEGSYRGWNCIGFAFACWRHGAGINCKCSCEVINDPEWDHLLVYSTDAEASQFATNRIGVPCKVIRNGGKAIPVSRLKAGDILCLFEGETSYHVIFYEGNGKYADCSSGGGDAIQAHNPITSVESDIKIAIRYGG